jgi:hypothetical protein
MSKHKRHRNDKEVIKQDEVTQKEDPKPEQNNLANLLSNIDMSQLSDFMSNLGMNSEEDNANGSTGVNDKRIELLSAIKPMLDSEKGQILDTIMQLYGISKILKKK